VNTKIRTIIITLIASASFAGASLAPVGASVAPPTASADVLNHAIDLYLQRNLTVAIGPITVCNADGTHCYKETTTWK